MKRDTAMNRIQVKLGFRGATFLTTEITNAFLDAQEKLESRPLLPWFLRTEMSSITTVSGEERVVTPSDFIREDEESALWYFDASADDADKWTEIVKDDQSVLRHKHPGDGPPIAYSIHGDYFRLFPTPDDVYTLKLAYYQNDTLLETNIENKWMLHASDLMIGLVGKDIATDLRDADAIAIFKDMIIEGQAQLVTDTEARRHENARYIIGDLD